jgi:Protein of unknown function (DUF1203)
MSSFKLVGLLPGEFSHLFSLSAEQLAPLGIARVTADSKPGFPCRISLQDAEPGEELLLLPYEHQPAASPYRASGPIYVRVGAQQSNLRSDEIPPYVSLRQISARAYDVHHMMVAAEVCPGEGVATEIQRQFSNPRVIYIHLHNAKRGCFSCRVERETRSQHPRASRPGRNVALEERSELVRSRR